MAKCGHLHATQFADPTPEGVAQRLPAKALEPLGTLKCLDCGDLFVPNPYISPVNAARSTLAQKVMEQIKTKHGEYQREAEAADKIPSESVNLWAIRARTLSTIDTALRELFQREGIELPPEKETRL